MTTVNMDEYLQWAYGGAYMDSIRRNVTTTNERRPSGVTIRRHVDHDQGDAFTAEVFNSSGHRVGTYKTEAGALRRAEKEERA